MTEEWKGEPAVLIGGGASLKKFNFAQLAGLHTIGINDAFRLGNNIVKFCMFGDVTWWLKCKWDLERYAERGGRVYSITPGEYLRFIKLSWLIRLTRVSEGLHRGIKCGWNNSTGAAAVNLALNLGARRIFLLGYDMTAIGSSTHWHGYRRAPTHSSSFLRFINGFGHVYRGLKQYPDAMIINVTDGASLLPYFPRMGMMEFERLVAHGID